MYVAWAHKAEKGSVMSDAIWKMPNWHVTSDPNSWDSVYGSVVSFRRTRCNHRNKECITDGAHTLHYVRPPLLQTMSIRPIKQPYSSLLVL